MRHSVRYWTLLFACLSPLCAFAEAPDFAKGRVVFGLQYGTGSWALDRAKLAPQVGDANADTFISQARNASTASVRLGYNILGHATIEADLTATGWELSSTNRGGAGFLAGLVHWHPLMLVWREGQTRPLPFDATVFFGLGYGLAGQDRGMDGRVLETGLTADYFLARSVSLGLFVRGVFLQFSNLYVDYDHRDVAGNTVPIPEGSGGAFWTFGVGLTFHFET